MSGLEDEAWQRGYQQGCIDTEQCSAKLVKGIQDYLDGNYPNPRDVRARGAQEKCPHGMFYYEACENCIDEHFTNVLKQSTEKP